MAKSLTFWVSPFTELESPGMHAKQLFYCALLFTIATIAGCQSWQGASFPMQNATRVAPPGTGTYQLPTGYYNNNSTSALAPTGQMMQASNDAASTLRTASGPLPTTNMTANQSAGNFAASGVVPAAFQSEASGQPTGATSNFSDSSVAGASASLSDAPNAEVPSLQWQQFGGQ